MNQDTTPCSADPILGSATTSLVSKTRSFCRSIVSLLLLIGGAAVAPAAPTVTVTSPTRNVLAPGQSVHLSVSATGNGTVTYQWPQKRKAMAAVMRDTFEFTKESQPNIKSGSDHRNICVLVDERRSDESAPIIRAVHADRMIRN